MVIGDIGGDGKVNAIDILLLRAEVNGVDRPEIPPVTVPSASLAFATLIPATESPVAPPFLLQNNALIEPQAFSVASLLSNSTSSESGPTSDQARRLREPSLPVINWKPATQTTQPRATYGTRPEWLKTFLSGGSAPGKTGLQPFTITI